MPLNDRDIGIVAAGVAIVAVIAWIAHNEAGGNTPSPVETADTNLNPNLGFVLDALDTGDHYFHPAYCHGNQDLIFLPHRYPHVPGANMSAVIHHGLDALRMPAPTDDSWRVGAPAELAW